MNWFQLMLAQCIAYLRKLVQTLDKGHHINMVRNWCSQHPQYSIWFLSIVFSADCLHSSLLCHCSKSEQSPLISTVRKWNCLNSTIYVKFKGGEKNSWCHWRDIDKSSYCSVNYQHKSSHHPPLHSSILNEGDPFFTFVVAHQMTDHQNAIRSPHCPKNQPFNA